MNTLEAYYNTNKEEITELWREYITTYRLKEDEVSIDVWKTFLKLAYERNELYLEV